MHICKVDTFTNTYMCICWNRYLYLSFDTASVTEHRVQGSGYADCLRSFRDLPISKSWGYRHGCNIRLFCEFWGCKLRTLGLCGRHLSTESRLRLLYNLLCGGVSPVVDMQMTFIFYTCWQVMIRLGEGSTNTSYLMDIREINTAQMHVQGPLKRHNLLNWA